MTAKKLHGVNLGGWLILEKWMTPSLFAGTDAQDEYELSRTPEGRERIKRHRRTFIVEEDFKWMKDNGVNAVRIPVGYWALESDDPFISAADELDWAMEMAKKYKLEVIIDLHGLKGSQNGYDHSGRVGRANWCTREEYREATLDSLEALARRYCSYDNLWGLQIINEPKIALFNLKLRRFYKAAYQRLEKTLKPHTHIIFSDAFTPRLLSGSLGKHTNRVVMDVHVYHMATLFSQVMSIGWFMSKLIWRGYLFERLSRTQPIIIGEWSGVMRHDTMRRLPKDEQAVLTRQYIQLQLDIFQDVAGWFYWSYKTSAPGLWNFRSLVEDGTINLKDK
jgi:glucan 1,3-beta-glucosidase